MDARALVSTHLVKYSTATRINLYCRVAIGKELRISIPQRSNGQALAIVIISVGGTWVNLLLTWHFSHRRIRCCILMNRLPVVTYTQDKFC
jgi:hypothetical protein